MKRKLYLVLASLFLLIVQVKAQAPNSFNYQGAARNSAGAVLQNQFIGLQFTIYQGSATGAVVYQETDTVTTNQFGLFAVSIGSGKVKSGAFSTIGWGANSEYLDVAMDPIGGTNYIDMGTQQLLSVPFALYAASSGNTYTAGTGIGISNSVINANTSAALWNANKLQGDSMSNVVPTVGQLLQWDGTSWTPATVNNGWSLTGNSGTAYGTNFIGTNDNQSLLFTVDGNESGRIENATSGPGYNTALGYEALFRNQSGTQNVAIGYNALYNNDNNGLGANNNTAVGSNAMYNNITGQGNTAVGTNALYTVQQLSGSNTAIGSYADIASDGISNSTAIGAGAIATASSVVQLGSGCSVQFDKALMPGGDPGTLGEVLQSNGYGVPPSWVDPSGGGGSSWSLGGNSGTKYGTSFIGTIDDVGLQFDVDGTEAGRIEDASSAYANTALGYESLYNNQSAGQNVAIGYGALYENDIFGFGSANDNTAVGYEALHVNQSGSQNVALGYEALYSNDNMGIGSGKSNTAVGYSSMLNNQDGAGNTAIGYNTLSTSQSSSSSYNTAIGYQANIAADGITNATAIGANAVVGESNALVLGGTGSNAVNVGVNTTIPNSTFQVSNGDISLPIVVSPTSIDLSVSHITCTVIITATGQTITLPAASSCVGRVYFIIAQLSSGLVTIDGYINFNGINTTTVSAGTGITIQSDGTNWDQIR